MSIELPNLGAKPTDLKISNVYKITNPDWYKRLNLIFADAPKNLSRGNGICGLNIKAVILIM